MTHTGIRLRVYYDGTVRTIHDIQIGDRVELTDDNGDFMSIKFDVEGEIALYFPGKSGKKKGYARWLQSFAEALGW